MKFIVFGLGNYGAALGKKLVDLGHEVFGVDSSNELVEKMKHQFTYTITMDATNSDAIQSLPLKEADMSVIAVGENEGTVILVAALLKQYKAKRIICRVTSSLQQAVLESMGLSEFVYPELDSAERDAFTFDFREVLDSHRICEKYHVSEVLLPRRYAEKKISEIDFEDKYNIQLVSVKRPIEDRNLIGVTRKKKTTLGNVGGELVLHAGDSLIIFGESDKISDFLLE
jgi:trk system potassium uptake protein TrkA